MREEQYVDHDGIRYWYVYRLANDGEICLGTTDPTKYCNGVYAYSHKDPGDGMAFVVINQVEIHSKERVSGFYWVKYPHGVWMIAMYTDGIGWGTFHGDPEEYPAKDDEFLEIDERPVVREDHN